MQIAAENAANAVGKKGSLWFVFVGHGAASPDGKDGLLIGFDAQQRARSITARSLKRAALIETPYEVLAENALFGAGFLVATGVVAATLSSALGSYLGAPRILQALARDHILPVIGFFGDGAPGTGEPRRGLILTGAITGIVLIVSDAAGPKALNAVAAVITMFFLYTYGMINLAAFIEGVSDNPSFRPRFRFFHWSV